MCNVNNSARCRDGKVNNFDYYQVIDDLDPASTSGWVTTKTGGNGKWIWTTTNSNKSITFTAVGGATTSITYNNLKNITYTQ